jgi:threonine 3-dehydrogenase
MAVLITGGTGFIGAEVVRLLLERGATKVVSMDRRALMSRLSDVADQVELRRGDVGNFGHVLRAVKDTRPTTIYHFGAMLSVPSEDDPAGSVQANAMGTFHVLEAARLFDVRQVIFASTIATFGADIPGNVIRDDTLQRPNLLYGACKLFGEHVGLYYRRKHGLDFRSVRYPSVVGPGVRSAGVVQYTSWMIEESVKGNPFTAQVAPRTRCPILYYKDAARAAVELADAPREAIRTVNYLVDGIRPTPSAAELAEAVRAHVPNARIECQPDEELQSLLDRALLRLDDSNARIEWGWKPRYDLDEMIRDFVRQMREHPARYG